jgi:hypothetical protein
VAPSIVIHEVLAVEHKNKQDKMHEAGNTIERKNGAAVADGKKTERKSKSSMWNRGRTAPLRSPRLICTCQVSG